MPGTSLAAFGRLFSMIAETENGPADPRCTLIGITDFFGADAAVLSIEPRARPGDAIHHASILAEPATQRMDARALAALTEHGHSMVMAVSGPDDVARYTLSVVRPRAAARFDAEESSLCRMLATHFARALDANARTRADAVERALYATVMDRIGVGVVLLDEAGRVVKASATADHILGARDGLQVQSGRLRATCATEDKALQAAIRAALQNPDIDVTRAPRGLSLTKASGARTVGIVAQRIPSVNAQTPQAVAVYVRDGETQADVESDLVRQLFDLTPAEAAVTRRLTAGLSLEDAAQSLAISRNTARAHLRSIFSKSGISRQTELVRMVLNSAVIIGEGPRRAA